MSHWYPQVVAPRQLPASSHGTAASTTETRKYGRTVFCRLPSPSVSWVLERETVETLQDPPLVPQGPSWPLLKGTRWVSHEVSS